MSVQEFARRLYWMCAEADGGYSQPNRLDVQRTRGVPGGYFTFEADCSSLVIEAAKQAGYPTGGATFTGDMRAAFEAAGWTVIPYAATAGLAANLYTGDVILSEAASGGVGHVAAYIGDNRVAEAWIDGRGDIMGSAEGDGEGDDTGGETRVVPFSSHPYTLAGSWTHVLRPPAFTPPADPGATTTTPTTPKGNPRMFAVSYNSIYGIKGYALITESAGAYALDRVGAQVYNDVVPMVEVPAHHAEMLIREAWERHNRVAATAAAETRVDIDQATAQVLAAISKDGGDK